MSDNPEIDRELHDLLESLESETPGEMIELTIGGGHQVVSRTVMRTMGLTDEEITAFAADPYSFTTESESFNRMRPALFKMLERAKPGSLDSLQVDDDDVYVVGSVKLNKGFSEDGKIWHTLTFTALDHPVSEQMLKLMKDPDTPVSTRDLHVVDGNSNLIPMVFEAILNDLCPDLAEGIRQLVNDHHCKE